ncbi:hypothetical protein [Bacteroides sp.]|uniref:hypothetical protein n=1 Tax=Bacteroides sp. TaxID=29523 RepID=UPI00261AB485|nr:hypothetical protein [Bacteroides sp.]MDD3038294.1 hypothetical protein [Bacteroides sp.]
MKQIIYPFKQLLSGGLLCIGVVIVAYLFEIFFPGMYVNAFSSSIYLSFWMVLLVGALIWTFREPGVKGLASEITDWQLIAAFFLFVSDRIYNAMPKEIHRDIAPVLSTYTLPILIIGSLIVAGIIKFSTSLYRRLEDERRQNALQTQRIQQLLDSPPTQYKSCLLIRKLIKNESIILLSASDNLQLVEECQIIDLAFFNWLRKQNLPQTPPPRVIILCVLIRMLKTKEEILTILDMTNDTYRVMKSRARKRLGIEDEDWETFLKEIK